MSEKSNESIGKFGIGFKLIHGLVADNLQRDLLEGGRGPIVFLLVGYQGIK